MNLKPSVFRPNSAAGVGGDEPNGGIGAGLLPGGDGAAPGRLPSSVILIGGGARSEAVRVAAPGIFGAPVDVPEAEECVALGAAR